MIARTTRPVRRGVAATELAFVMPVMALLLLGGIDFGRVIHVELTLTSAARAAAEYGGTHPYTTETRDRWETRVKQAALDDIAGTSFDPNLMTVEVSTTGTGTDARVSVSVSYPFQTITHWPGVPSSVTARRVAVMPVSRP